MEAHHERASGIPIENVARHAGSWHHDRQTFAGTPIMPVTYAPLPKKSANVSLAESLLAEAKDLGLNVSQAAEAGLARAVSDKRAEVWLKENAEAIAGYNDYIEKNGLPLDEFRMF